MPILHISDIHFGINNYCENEADREKYKNKSKVLDDLILTLVEHQDEPLWKIEHIIVTGDIAWRGKNLEFEEAKIWFLRLLSALNLTGADLTFCVGNHDINRKHAVRLNAEEHDGDSTASIKRIDSLYTYDNISVAEPLIYSYNAFCESLGVIPFKTIKRDGSIGYSYSVGFKEISACGKSVRIFAFNTSVLSSGEYKEDRMWLGQQQLFALEEKGIITSVNNPKDKSILYRIAIFHHAERYLHPNELSEYDGRVATFPRLMKHVDLALCGHTETGGIPVLWQKVGGGKLLTGGATYFSDAHPNSFSVIILADESLEGKKTEIQCFYATIRYDEERGWFRDFEKSIPPEQSLQYSEPQFRTKGKVNFVTKFDDEEYIIPITGYFLNEDSSGNFVFNNYYQIDRLLDISIEFKKNWSSSFCTKLAPNMEFSVEAMLEREKYFNFIGTWFERAKTASIEIQDESGQMLAQYTRLKGWNADKTEALSIELLERLKILEDYYGVKFLRPEEMYEIDLHRIQVLEDIMMKGYIDAYPFPHITSAGLSDRNKIKRYMIMVMRGRRFHICYEGNFKIDFLGATIRLDQTVKIYSPLATVANAFDIVFKYLTFRHNDVRDMNIVIDEMQKCRMYFWKVPEMDDFIKAPCLGIPRNIEGKGYRFDFMSEVLKKSCQAQDGSRTRNE